MFALSGPRPIAAVLPAVPAAAEGTTPLHCPPSAAFQSLVRMAAGDDVLARIASLFLGAETPMQHFQLHGKLRAALLWQTLPGFLAAQGMRVAGVLGAAGRHSGAELAVPEFESLRLGPELWLELPKNVLVFVEPADEGGTPRRAVLRFDDNLFRDDGVAVGAFHLDARPLLVEAWIEYARRHNPLRGCKLLGSGTLVEPRTDPEASRLFLPAAVRDRLDFAVRRFTSAHAARLRRLGVRQRAGLILAGPPGTGKSSIGRELAESLATSFLWVTPGDLTSGKAVHELYELARWLAPTLVFLEDLDLVAESRERGNDRPVLGQLMNELDGGAGDHPVLTIATTNRLSVVEQAIRNRPGRFDQVIEIDLPDPEGRRALLAHRLRGAETAAATLDWCCRRLEGATGAEIEEVANGALAAAVLAAEGETVLPRLERHHFEHALEAIARSPERSRVGFEGGA